MKTIFLMMLSSLCFITCPTQTIDVPATGLYKSNDYEFSFLDEYLKDKRIVAIGESSHGIGDFYTLKSSLVRHLYVELGFEIMAMEGGFGDINLAWTTIESLSAEELRKNTVFKNFQCKEIEPLFQLIKENSKTEKPLIYTGFDCQTSSSNLEKHLNIILQLGDEKLATEFENGLEAYYKIYPSVFEKDSTNFVTNRDKFLDAVASVSRFIKNNRKAIQAEYQYSDKQMKVIARSLKSLWKSMDIAYATRFNEENIFIGIPLRDELMFENLKWIMEEFYPDKKVIIWGHNAHIQKGKLGNSNTKFMGQLLKEEYGDQYYSLGLFAYKGKAYQHWTKENIPFENSDSTFIENKMNASGDSKFTFQNLNNQKRNSETEWMYREMNALEMENGGTVGFKPVERFDGMLTLYEVDIPNYE